MGSGSFREVPKGSGAFQKVPEGSGKVPEVPEGSGRYRKVLESSGFVDERSGRRFRKVLVDFGKLFDCFLLQISV